MRARLYHGSLYKPRKTEAHQNVEDIATYGVTDRHVAETFLYDRQRGKGIRYAHASGNESQAHHGVGNAQSASYNCDHPHHYVAVETDPDHRYTEGEGIPAPPLLLSAIRHRRSAHKMDRIHETPGE